MALPWHTVTLVGIINENGNTRRFFLEFDDLDYFDFKSGQFVKLEIKEGLIRSYSIASSLKKTKRIELLIVKNDQGELTPMLFDEVAIGSKLKIQGPFGNFLLPTNPNETFNGDVCFIATGTGIAPMRSMIQDLIFGGFKGQIFLIFGNRTIEGLFYREKFEALEKLHPSFHFYPTLSRETREIWKGKKGRVHTLYQNIYRDKRPCDFYICGWAEMVKEAKENILALEYENSHIHIENYG
jgi:CDP-4-dehydro-6-deoxyglucose reductase